MSAFPVMDILVAGAACIVIGAGAGVCYSVVAPACCEDHDDGPEGGVDTTIVQAKKKKRRTTKFEASVRKNAFESVKKSAVPLNILQFKNRYYTDVDHVLLAHLMIDPKRRIERLVFDFAESNSSVEEPPKFKRLAVDRKAINSFKVLSLVDAEVVEIYLDDHIALENKSKGHTVGTTMSPALPQPTNAEVILVVKRPKKELEDPSDAVVRLKTLLQPYFRQTKAGDPAPEIATDNIVDLKTNLSEYARAPYVKAP